jgi:Flp pilus assembly pilin Flp
MTISPFALVKRFAREERGASLVEYAVLVALITGALVAAVLALGGAITGSFTAITNVLTGNQAGT